MASTEGDAYARKKAKAAETRNKERTSRVSKTIANRYGSSSGLTAPVRFKATNNRSNLKATRRKK